MSNEEIARWDSSAPLRLATIGTQRPDAVCVDVELSDGHGNRALVAVWATTLGEAVMNAEACCDERLGGEWVLNDWKGLR